MARIRSLKPEIWMSPQVMNLSHSARLLFIGLITQADDEGRGTADSRRMKAAIFGGDDEPSANVRRWLDEIQDQGLTAVYEAEDHGLVYQLTGWKSHQKIDRAKPSAYPPPPAQTQRRLIDDQSSTTRRGSDGSDRIGSSGSDRTVPAAHDDSSSGKGEDNPDEHPPLTAQFAEFLQEAFAKCPHKRAWSTALHNAGVIVETGKATEADLRRRLTAYVKFVESGGVTGWHRGGMTPQSWFELHGEDPSWAKEWETPPPGDATAGGWRPDPEEERQFQERLAANRAGR